MCVCGVQGGNLHSFNNLERIKWIWISWSGLLSVRLPTAASSHFRESSLSTSSSAVTGSVSFTWNLRTCTHIPGNDDFHTWMKVNSDESACRCYKLQTWLSLHPVCHCTFQEDSGNTAQSGTWYPTYQYQNPKRPPKEQSVNICMEQKQLPLFQP